LEIIKAAGRKLRRRGGSVVLTGAILTVVVFMLLAVSLEVARIYGTIGMLKRNTDAAVRAAAAENAGNIFGGVRESDGNARGGEDGAWGETVSTDEVWTLLKENLELTREGSELVRHGESGREAYRLTGLSTKYENADGDVLHFETTVTVEIPLSFLGGGITLKQFLEVKTSYDARF